MPPRRKKQSNEPAQSQETKEFTDARNKILAITPESLALFQNTPNHSLEHLSDDPYATDVLHLVNAVDFLNEIIPLISTCPFHTQDEIRQFIDGVHNLYELGNSIKKENMTSINYVNDFKPIWDSIRNFAVHININLFHEMFSTSRSTISSVLRHIVQMAHEDPRSNPIIFDRFKSVASTRKRLATRLSVLMHGRKIRTVITLWDKLIETQREVIEFFKATGLMTAEMMSTVNNCFKLMFDSALHLKNLLVIQQLAAIIDRCLAHPLKCPIPPISDDEEEIDVDPQPGSENEIGRAITDELILEVHETTDFLRVYKQFIEEVNPTIDKGEFLTKFQTFLEKSQSFNHFDLCPTLFSMFYKFRQLEVTSLPIMISAEYDPNAKEIKSLYRNLQILIHNATCLSGEEIDAESSLELLYPIIDKIRQDCSEVTDPNFQDLIKNLLASLDSICEELQAIDDTICISFQGDQMIRKFEDKNQDLRLNPFNFHCLFYKVPPVYDTYEPDREQHFKQNLSRKFNDLIENFLSTLKKFNIEMQIEKAGESRFRVTVPDIYEYFLVLLENYSYRQIQVILASPPNETVFFTNMFELQKEMLLNDVADERLDSSITVFSTVYYLLLLLDYAGYIEFSNSIHFVYFKAYARINFCDDQISSLITDLNTPFDSSQIEDCSEAIESLVTNSKQSEIDDKLKHMRNMVFLCIDSVCHLSPEILRRNFDDLSMLVGKFTFIITELADTLTSDEFFDLLCRLKDENIPEITEFIGYCIEIHKDLKECWKVIPIQANLLSYLHVDNPSFTYKKATIYDLIDFIKLCMKFGLIYCDINYFESIVSEPKWPPDLNSICKNFLKTIVISHDVLFKMLTIAASGLSNCSKINETVDLIGRGMFDRSTVKVLLLDLLHIRAQCLAPPDKIEFMNKYAHQLTAFLMLLNTVEILYPHSGVSVARTLNMRNFLLSYCNSIIYLTNTIETNPELSSSIVSICTDLKRLVFPVSPNDELTNEKSKEIYDMYLKLRMKFGYVSPMNLIQTARSLIEKVDDVELREKFEIVLNTLNSPSVSEAQENIDGLIEILRARFEYISSSSTSELYEVSMKIYDILSTLIVFYSRIRDEEAFFIFASTKNFTVHLQSPPILSPLTPVVSLSPFLPHQHMFNSTNKAFKKFYKTFLNEKVKGAFEDQFKANSEDDGFLFPPPFVLPLESQQKLMDLFMTEKEKFESSSTDGQKGSEKSESVESTEASSIDPKSQSTEAEILKSQIAKLESESGRLLKTIAILNDTTSELYEEFVSSQTDQFSQFDQVQAQALNDVRTNVQRESEMKSLSIELRRRSNYLAKLNQENESLSRSNKYLRDAIKKRRGAKERFDSNLNANASQKNLNANSSSCAARSRNQAGVEVVIGKDSSTAQSGIDLIDSSSPSSNQIGGLSLGPTAIPGISDVDGLLIKKEKNVSPIFDEAGFVPEALTGVTNPLFCAMRKEDSDLIRWTVRQWEEMEAAKRNHVVIMVDDESDESED